MKRPLLFLALLIVGLAPLAMAAIPGVEKAVLQLDATSLIENIKVEQPAQQPAEQLILRNPQGVELGEVINLLVDPEMGVIAYILVDTGGNLDEKDLRLVPVSALAAENDELILNMNEEQLSNAPSPSSEQEPIEFHRSLADYYGVAPYWEE